MHNRSSSVRSSSGIQYLVGLTGPASLVYRVMRILVYIQSATTAMSSSRTYLLLTFNKLPCEVYWVLFGVLVLSQFPFIVFHLFVLTFHPFLALLFFGKWYSLSSTPLYSFFSTLRSVFGCQLVSALANYLLDGVWAFPCTIHLSSPPYDQNWPCS